MPFMFSCRMALRGNRVHGVCKGDDTGEEDEDEVEEEDGDDGLLVCSLSRRAASKWRKRETPGWG